MQPLSGNRLIVDLKKQQQQRTVVTSTTRQKSNESSNGRSSGCYSCHGMRHLTFKSRSWIRFFLLGRVVAEIEFSLNLSSIKADVVSVEAVYAKVVAAKTSDTMVVGVESFISQD